MQREDPVLVAGELGEPSDVVPDPLVGGVEQVRAVAVYLDTGLRVGFGVGVASEMGAALHDEHTLAQFIGHALGDRQAEESGADDKQICAMRFSGHRQQGYPTGACPLETRDVAGLAWAVGTIRDRSQLAHDSASSL